MASGCNRGVSVVVPCLNEARHVEAFLRNLIVQESLQDGRPYEFLIADGRSEDGTREVIENLARTDPRIRLIDNPDRMIAPGLNRAIRESRYDIIVRMDVHSEYASDYVRRCVEVLEDTGAQNVGGSARTIASGYIQQAICLAYHAWFSVGGARFHDEEYEGWVDTVTYGCWKKQTLLDIGMFDEELVRNQDDELNLRIIISGGQIWQSRQIKSWYHPRDSLWLLFRQYTQYGYWKVRVIQKHRLPASYRHLVPPFFIFALIVSGMASPFSTLADWLLLVLLGVYGLASLAASLITCHTGRKLAFIPVMPLVFAVYHFGYGYGFILGIIDFVLLKTHSTSSLPTRKITYIGPNYTSNESSVRKNAPW